MFKYNKQHLGWDFQFSIRKTIILEIASYYGMHWIRLLNTQVTLKDTSKFKKPFSERNNYKKSISIGNFIITHEKLKNRHPLTIQVLEPIHKQK